VVCHNKKHKNFLFSFVSRPDINEENLSTGENMKMRRSRVLEKLRAGEVVSCFKINLDSVRSAEVAAMQGFDCIWTDVEHTATDWSLIESQVYVAKAYDADLMVRVRRGSYSEYSAPLELDASGLLVPHVMSLEDAKQVVRMTRFHPLGLRALDGGNADGGYCTIGVAEYLQTANEQRFVAIQIEDPEPLEELDAIAALPGIDMLFFGPGDFSQALGVPGDLRDPRVIEAQKLVAQAAIKHGKFAATVATPDTLEEKIEQGYRFLNMGADVIGVNEYCARMRACFGAPLSEPDAGGVYK
jgi:4-hydroxy-2-oxoheptanedioate aldolase